MPFTTRALSWKFWSLLIPYLITVWEAERIPYHHHPVAGSSEAGRRPDKGAGKHVITGKGKCLLCDRAVLCLEEGGGDRHCCALQQSSGRCEFLADLTWRQTGLIRCPVWIPQGMLSGCGSALLQLSPGASKEESIRVGMRQRKALTSGRVKKKEKLKNKGKSWAILWSQFIPVCSSASHLRCKVLQCPVTALIAFIFSFPS